MGAGSHVLQLFHGADAGIDQLRAVDDHLFIPEVELRRVALALAEQLEQGIALGEGFGVFRQGCRVMGDHLSQGQVQVAAALFGGAFDHRQHLRQEEHGVELPHGGAGL